MTQLIARGALCPNPNSTDDYVACRYHQKWYAVVPSCGSEFLADDQWQWQTADGQWLFCRIAMDGDGSMYTHTWRVWPEAGHNRDGVYVRQERLAEPVFPPGFVHEWTLRPADDIRKEQELLDSRK